jgi:hypothetical protein
VAELLRLQDGVTEEMAARFAALFRAAAGDPGKLDAAAIGFANARNAALNAAKGTNTLTGSLGRFGNAAQQMAQRFQAFSQQMFQRAFGGPFGSGPVLRMPTLPPGLQFIGSPSDFFGTGQAREDITAAGADFREQIESGADRVQQLYESLVGISNPFDVVGGFTPATDPALAGATVTVNVSTRDLHPDQVSPLVDRIEKEIRTRGRRA